MMGERQVLQTSLFHEFSLEDHVPADNLIRSIERFVDLSDIRRRLAPFYSAMGRPSIDPELMIRMPLVGACFGIRSERRLCQKVHLNLAYRWFCRLDLSDPVPDHSTSSKNRHVRFPDSDLFRRLFETVRARCFAEGLVGGEAFGVDASLIKADANREDGIEPERRSPEDHAGRAVGEVLETLGWLVEDRGIEPHVPVIDKSRRRYGTDRREVFTCDLHEDAYFCPAGKRLSRYRRPFRTARHGVDPEGMMRRRASTRDCDACPLRPRCTPKEPGRKILCSIHEGARDLARDIAKTDAYAVSLRQRKKVEMLFAHLKRILKMDRLRLRGPNGARDELLLAATAQNLRKLARLAPSPA